MKSHQFSESVKAAAAGQWPFIFQQLAGADDRQVSLKSKNQGAPCPSCGGEDRYHLRSIETGWWYCRHCGGGDGFSLLMRVNGWRFPETIRHVAELLGIRDRSAEDLDRIIKRNEARRQERERQYLQQQRQRSEDGIMDARRLWQSATPYREHPYAIEKRFSQRLLGICRQHGSWLLVPMYLNGELVNVQRFAWRKPEGEKRLPRFFVKGAPVRDALLAYGPDSFTVMICEGIADADACYQLEHGACRVVCAFSAGQLPAAAAWVSRTMPESQIILCHDNDPAGRAAAAKVTVPHCLQAPPPDPGNDWSGHFLSQSQELAL